MSDSDAEEWAETLRGRRLFLPLGNPPLPKWLLNHPKRLWWAFWFVLCNGLLTLYSVVFKVDWLSFVSETAAFAFLIFVLVCGMATIIWAVKHYDFARWFEDEMQDRIETETKFLVIQQHFFDNPYADDDDD